MNICMFTNTYLPHVGGVARSVHLFSEDLRRVGHRVLVVAPEFQAPAPDDRDTLRIPAIQNFNGSDFSVRLPLPYVAEAQVEHFNPDIIHSHHPFLLGDTAMRMARRKSLPLVFTHHTLYEQYTHYVPLDSNRLQSFVVNLSTLYANLCDGVVAPSQSIARLIAARGVRVPIATIPTGVDIAFFASGNGHRFRQAYKIPSDALVVGHLGRLAPEKNLNFLVAAAIRFMSAHATAVFVVIGDGPSREEICRHFREADMADRLITTGRQTGRSLADAYAAMDLFVFASRSETQGMVLAEAMAAGVPVVALDASGVRDIVVDGQNGRLLPETASVEDFAAALHAAAEHPDRVRQWRNQALQTVRKMSREACAEQLLSFYRNRIAEKQAKKGRSIKGLKKLYRVLEGIRVEWDLLATKVKSVVDATASKECEAKPLNHRPQNS